MTHWRQMIDAQAATPDALDAKTQLQELLAADGKAPEYRDAGGRVPPMLRRFRVGGLGGGGAARSR